MAPLPSSEDENTSMDVDNPKTETTTDLNVTPSASADTASKYPDMLLAQSIHRLLMCKGKNPLLESASEIEAAGISPDLESKVCEQITKELENPSLYRYMISSGMKWSTLSGEELTKLDAAHSKTLSGLEEKVNEAKESAGDMEVLEARFEVARFAAKSLSKEDALEAYEKIFALPKLSSGKKIDALMEQARVASFYGDTKKNAELIEKAVQLANDGGDWDRRNRLKVYNALSKILARDVKGAASLLIDCIATFSCNELCSYTKFIVYTIICNILHLPRTELKQKIVDGPEILSVANEIPVVVSCYHHNHYLLFP